MFTTNGNDSFSLNHGSILCWWQRRAGLNVLIIITKEAGEGREDDVENLLVVAPLTWGRHQSLPRWELRPEFKCEKWICLFREFAFSFLISSRPSDKCSSPCIEASFSLSLSWRHLLDCRMESSALSVCVRLSTVELSQANFPRVLRQHHMFLFLLRALEV